MLISCLLPKYWHGSLRGEKNIHLLSVCVLAVIFFRNRTEISAHKVFFSSVQVSFCL